MCTQMSQIQVPMTRLLTTYSAQFCRKFIHPIFGLLNYRVSSFLIGYLKNAVFFKCVSLTTRGTINGLTEVVQGVQRQNLIL